MAVQFTVDQKERLIRTKASGAISLAQLFEHISKKKAAKVIDYSELFDARDIALNISLTDLPHLGSKVREAQGSLSPGKVAVVTNSNFVRGLASAYAGFVKEENPRVKIFQSLAEAEAWIFRDANR